MSQLVNTNPADLDLDIPGITFREGTAEDVHLFPQFFKWKSAADAHKRMIDSGDVMALAFDGDRPIGIYLASIWQDNVNPHESDFKAIRRLFDIMVGEDAISHGLFVLPDCRQRGVGAQLSFELSKALAKHGCKQVYSVINIKNEASVRTHQKIGRQTIANVSSTQIFNFKIIRPQSTSAENINRAKATSR
jgi:GNAT superfamily N-acetyltransferase